MEIKEFLRTMSAGVGVSGYEDAMAEQISAACPWVDEIRRDKLGNLIMLKKGQGPEPRPKVMLAAHMDEIGLVITEIDKKGFLRFSTIGGFDQRVLLAQEVMVHGKQSVPGVIGAKPPHVQTRDEQTKAVKLEELFIDIGYDSKAEVEEVITIGDLVTLKQTPVDLQNHLLAGKAMDDRAGVASILECLKELSTRTHHADVYAVATVQEEVGLRGAITSTYGIVPDVGIALDVGHGDMPGVAESDSISLGNGPGIAIGPHVHPSLYERFTKIARDWNIKFSSEPSPFPGGTDTYAIQVTQAGVPTLLLSLPLRYMHTPVETLDYSDVISTGRLLSLFITQLESEFVEGLRCF